jgi:hypothetical protein
MMVLNPCWLISIRYVPGSIASKRKLPSSVETLSRVTPVLVFMIYTTAPETTAPF